MKKDKDKDIKDPKKKGGKIEEQVVVEVPDIGPHIFEIIKESVNKNKIDESSKKN